MNQKKELFIVIDGNSLLYRAFFAMRYLSTSDGQPTNAIYGLTTMLLKVLEEKPDYIAVAFDTPVPTFRHADYEMYKAHRKPPPDDLIAQKPLARELVRAFNIPVIEIDGYEADDVVGALARKASERGVRTIIVTGDLDALQLVNDNVSVMATIKGISETTLYDPKAVEERFGLKPGQMADYKGLKGDPSDNIPGVPGIGDKTAADLLRRYGTIENLIEHISELPEGKVRNALEQNVELAKISKSLATIVTDLPMELNLEDYRTREPDYDALRDLFVRLEFKSLLKRLPEVEKAEGKGDVEQKPSLGACKCIESFDELKDFIEVIKKSGECALQTHTHNGKSIEAELIGLGFSVGKGNTAYVRITDSNNRREQSLSLMFDKEFSVDLSELENILSSNDIAKYCHDSKLAYAALALRNVNLRNVKFDTMLGAYLLDATRSSFNLWDVAFEQLSLELPGVTRKEEEAEIDHAINTCAEAEAIYILKPVIEQRLRDDGLIWLYENVELPLAPILAEMELAGVAVDVEQLESLSAILEAEIRSVEQRVYELAGEQFNIGSPKQLQVILFDKLGMRGSQKTKTGFSTSAAALEELAAEHPIVEEILRYRELSKIKSTYADALPRLINPKTGRIHTSLNQAVTTTGRLSSSDPNLQNIPIKSELGREIRKAFIASNDNLLLSADYSQIELRILAHITDDKALVSAFENDEDIHTATACTLFNVRPDDVTPDMRRRAKTVNFAVIYGKTDYSLGRELGISTHEAREFIDSYFAKFPGVLEYTKATIESAREQGYVTTLTGRRRYVPDINAANRNVRQNAERAAVNMPIQGTAADIMKLAMIRVHNEIKEKAVKSKLLLQVHDELLLEVPRDEQSIMTKLVREGMEKAFELRVPLKVDVKVGKNWAEMSEA